MARIKLNIVVLLSSMLAIGLAESTSAQENGRPAPEAPPQTAAETPPADVETEPQPVSTSNEDEDGRFRPSNELEPIEQAHLNRRPIPEGKVNFAFDNVEIKEIVPWLAKITGKIVMPLKLDGSGIGIGSTGGKITVIVDEPVEKEKALDMLFSALRMNGIAVIERPNLIILTKLDLGTITDEMSDIPVLDAAVDIRGRQDRGTIVMKIFPVTVSDAAEIKDKISEMKPQYAEVWVDELSNQIIVLGDIGLCQQYDKIIRELDQKWLNRRMHTFRLKWADANEIATNIDDLFSGGTSTSSSRRSSGNSGNQRTQTRGGNNRSTGGSTDSGIELRLTVNVQQNTVTVQTEPGIMEEIATLIGTEWDLPRSAGTSRLFELKYTDPKKIASLLETVLDGSSSGSTSTRGGQGNQRANATQAISGIYSIEAYSDKNALLVLAKTVESFDFIASIIEELDQPSSVGVPRIIQLKYARAVELSEELNVLLSKPGTNVSIPRPDTGLSGEGFESPTGTSTGAGAQNTTTSGQELNFPWQRGSEDDEQSPESSLIGKVRIVPIVRQNALAVLAPPAFLDPMVELIENFDRPRRQVLLSATVVEVDITDQLNFGFKYGQNAQASDSVGGQFWGGGLGQAPGVGNGNSFTATVDNFLGSLLDGVTTSTLNINTFDVRVIIEALAQVTNTRIIQEPRVFTADNEEAVFFSGKEVPIPVSNTTDLAGGNSLNTQFEYRDVGVFLNVRPRITQEGTVDLEISLQLSDQVGSTLIGSDTNADVFSRKQVNSHVIVLDGQTVVIGGLLKETERQFKSKIPLLGDIPIIGELFKYTDETMERNELLAFITPSVVQNPDENYENFNREDLIRLEEVSRPLAEQLANQEKIDLNINERIAGQNLKNAKKAVDDGNIVLPDRDPKQTEIDSDQIDMIDVDAN